jgi:hypothetical protein
LVRRQWSLKEIHRLIVTSATYRQASRPRAEAMHRDAGNRLLWRKSPVRLEAEAVRDAVLVAADQLNRRPGGPGFQDFTTATNNSQFYFPSDPDGYEFQRRSLYRSWIRSGRNNLLDVFDCPDPSTKTPRRAVTTTPLQALALLNNSFLLRMTDRFAERVRADAGPDRSDQVRRAYSIAFGREPDAEEARLSHSFVGRHGLAALGRVLFNGNEFLVVD